MAKRLCKCGHRFYKHQDYPLDWPFCKGSNVPKYSPLSCDCFMYDPIDNLEYLEECYLKRVNKNVKK